MLGEDHVRPCPSLTWELINRRAFLASTAALLASRVAHAATVTDATGRALPSAGESRARVSRRATPAAILLYTLAPDLLLGWPRANRPEECAYMLPGRLHSRRGRPHHRAW